MRHQLLEFASRHDYGSPDVRCDLPNPVEELSRLLAMQPSGCISTHADTALPAPVWDENHFKAGRITHDVHIEFWEQVILRDHPQKEYLMENIRGMRPQRYFQKFKGRFAGKQYDCTSPPARIFRNNWPQGKTSTGEDPESWALSKVMGDVATGAVIDLGKVGEVPPPRVVLPLSVEMEKPRLIHDARYTNLWTRSRPFSMGRVSSVPEVLPRGGFLVNYDHKSGYHAFLFAPDAREYFGFSIGGRYFVPAAGIFGWNMLPEIYHLAHEALLEFAARMFNIPSLAYLDDALSGSFWNSKGGRGEDEATARWGIRVLLWLNFLAGYSISVKKSVLKPVQRLDWLGLTIDALLGEFSIPPRKKESFLSLIRSALALGKVAIRDLERIAGKGISFMVAIGEAAMIYTRELFNILSLIHKGRMAVSSMSVKISKQLQRVFEVWIQFLDRFEGAPWMNTMHHTLRIETDASSRRWGGVLKLEGKTVLEVGEEFDLPTLALHIEAKEAIAVTKVIAEIAAVRGWSFIRGCRIDAWIDNLPLVFALKKGASAQPEVHREIERLFWWKLEHKFTLAGIWWDTHSNAEADRITRTERDNDYYLTDEVFRSLWDRYGPFQADLMASSVNVKKDMNGESLPFFSRFRSPGCAGVNILASSIAAGRSYCFPPTAMLLPVVNHVISQPNAIEVVLIVSNKSKNWLPRARTVASPLCSLPAGSVRDYDGRACDIDFSAWLIVSAATCD